MLKILEILKGSVRIKLSIKPLANKVIDDVLEPALQKIVEDSSNKLDDIIMASILPGLKKELKERVGVELDKLKEKIPESVRDLIEIE
jgi:hypothetical protein